MTECLGHWYAEETEDESEEGPDDETEERTEDVIEERTEKKMGEHESIYPIKSKQRLRLWEAVEIFSNRGTTATPPRFSPRKFEV